MAELRLRRMRLNFGVRLLTSARGATWKLARTKAINMRTHLRVIALLIGSLALVAIWTYSPALPAEPHIVANSAREVADLPPGSRFLMEGLLLVPPSDSSWEGYPVFQRAVRTKDDTGDRALRVQAERRPAVTIRTQTDDLKVAAESYSLRHAPQIPPTRWFRREQENRGFRADAPVVAVGSISGVSTIEVHDLAIGPLSIYRHERATAERNRRLLTVALKVSVSLLVAAFVGGALFKPQKLQPSS